MAKQTKFDISKTVSKVQHALKQLPKDVAVIIENDVNQNFDKESFENRKWEKRKRPDRNTKRRNLLVKSGQLKREATNIKTSGNRIYNDSDLVYFDVHNEGAPDKNIPERTFLKMNDSLEKEIIKEIEQQIMDAFK